MPEDTLSLRPEDDPIGRAMQWLEAIADREDWAPKARFGLTLSMDEALTNILAYAFTPIGGTQGAPSIELTYANDGCELRVEIADNGHAFDPTSLDIGDAALTLDEAEVGGHGLRLMRHYLKSFHYRREGAWNRLTLVLDSPAGLA
ncbi:ATP-binding protein [Achromobacter aloeverae]|uniref:ATP-binding protein n=1 Tax=Achromobacter aloeverae TaxID=1750518 RepID=A0A4Q1HKS1_9BURK|nr:ATP-binding protein [Achromobacter aloeverae]RXN90483.1 ATP-binding protein [Achromobacter aloeverae]